MTTCASLNEAVYQPESGSFLLTTLLFLALARNWKYFLEASCKLSGSQRGIFLVLPYHMQIEDSSGHIWHVNGGPLHLHWVKSVDPKSDLNKRDEPVKLRLWAEIVQRGIEKYTFAVLKSLTVIPHDKWWNDLSVELECRKPSFPVSGLSFLDRHWCHCHLGQSDLAVILRINRRQWSSPLSTYQLEIAVSVISSYQHSIYFLNILLGCRTSSGIRSSCRVMRSWQAGCHWN